MSSLWFTAAASLLCVVAWILWRTWPVLAGSARPADLRAVRLLKWNRHLLKLMRKTLGDRLLVAQVGFFTSTQDGQEHSLATWALQPTLIPDVEYLALARPGAKSGSAEVAAMVGARELRELLGDAVQPHAMWGHTGWIYDWPPELDIDRLVASLTPVAQFRAAHGLVTELEAAEAILAGTDPAKAGARPVVKKRATKITRRAAKAGTVKSDDAPNTANGTSRRRAR